MLTHCSRNGVAARRNRRAMAFPCNDSVAITGVCRDRRSLSWRGRCPALFRGATRGPPAAPRSGSGADRPRRDNSQAMAPACPRASRAGRSRRLPSSRHRLVAVASPVRERQALLAGLEVELSFACPFGDADGGDTFPTQSRPRISVMESATLAKQSVPAETSEFFRAELAAFVTMKWRLRPTAWARVEALKRACWRDSPATAEGSPRPHRVLDCAEARQTDRAA